MPRGPLPWHVSVLAGAYVARQLVDSRVAPFAALRPTVAAVLIGLGLLFVGFLIVREARRAGVLATAALVAIVRPELPVLALVGVVAAVVVRPGRAVSVDALRRTTIGLNAVSAVLALAVAVGAVMNGSVAVWIRDAIEPVPVPALETPHASSPDVYLLLLDEYPGETTLREIHHYDNDPFLGGLRSRGFDVYGTSHSNYMNTNLTLASMFAMKPLHEIDDLELRGDEHADDVALNRAMNRSAGLAMLSALGYETVATHPGYEHVALRGADRVELRGRITRFEVELIHETALRRLLDATYADWVSNEYRSWVVNSLEFVPSSGATDGRPQFTFVHVVSPHPPILLGPQAERGLVEDLNEFHQPIRRTDPQRLAAFVGQLEALNGLVLAAVDRARAAIEPDPVIIVMSDHGTDTLGVHAYWQWIDRRERLENLFAASTPGAPGLFGVSPTPVNLLPILLNHYAGQGVPKWPDVGYAWTGDGWETISFDEAG